MLAGGLLLALLISIALLPAGMGKTASKPKFSQLFSKTPAINWLSAARFFLFGSRDIWFVVALPVYLHTEFQWDFMQVGGFMALWVIGYGVVQASAPAILRRRQQHDIAPAAHSVRNWALVLATLPAAMALLLDYGYPPHTVVIVGLLIFGVVFAINSAVHSYLIVALLDHEKVSLNVGFYIWPTPAGD